VYVFDRLEAGWGVYLVTCRSHSVRRIHSQGRG